jgi:hypothetical protein
MRQENPERKKNNRNGAIKRAPRFRLPGCRHEDGRLNAAHQEQNYQNQNHQPDTAGWVVPPTAAVRPGGRYREQQHDQKD